MNLMNTTSIMPVGKGRGKVNYTDLKKEENVAGPKSSLSLSSNNNPEQAMDEYLKSLNLCRKPVAKDGSCLFRVVSEQVFKTQSLHQKVREDCISYMRDHKKTFEAFIEGSFEHYLFNLRNLKEWGGHSEISALSFLYKHDFVVYQIANPTPQDVTKNGFEKKVHLCYLNNNHYDSVHPLSFKANAAFVQSILYELLLDNVFAEVDKRDLEMSKASSSFIEETPSSGWTEVKTKNGKGKPLDSEKSSDNLWDQIISAIPEAGKNPKVNRSLKASLDPSIFRNIELEVWENSRSEQQRHDLSVAATYQFKPGDLCLATIRESKDVCKTVRVKIHKIAADNKCIVLSENHESQYYVQLDDLHPLVNGDADYKSLPGYYNKFENDKDAEFQSQKRRGKHGRKSRDDDRKTDGNNFANNSARPDSRNNRRNGRKEGNGGKKDIELNKAKENKKTDTLDSTSVKSPITEEGGPIKVAKPAESPASFWGRMRSNKPAGPNDALSTLDKLPENDKIDEPLDGPTVTSNPSEQVEEIINLKEASTANDYLETNKNNKTLNNSINSATLNATMPSVNATVQSVSVMPKAPTTLDVHSSVSSTNNVHTSSVISNTIVHDAQKFNLTTQASAKVNEVRENIILSSAKMENFRNSISPQPLINSLQNTPPKHSEPETENESTPQNESTPHESASRFLNNICDITRPTIATQNTYTMLSEDPSKQILNKISPDSGISPDMEKMNMNDVPPNTFIKFPEQQQFLTVNEFDTNVSSDSAAELSNESIEVHKPIVKTAREKSKKKVSFGGATEIIERNPSAMMVTSHTSADTNTHMMSSSEPGKIHLPPEHIEKHMNNFPTNASPMQYQDVLNTQQQEHSHQQQPRVVQQTFLPSGMPFYYHHPHQQQSHIPPVFPMFYRSNNDPRMIPQMSHDPEGKDLPEDILVLQHFYNLGVQLFCAQQNIHQINQAGILPLPVATPLQTLPVRPIVLNAESTSRSGDIYTPSSQSGEGVLDIQQQSQAANILQARMQAPHINFHHPHIQQQGAPFEEYETPPRLRRGPIQGTGIGLGGPTHRSSHSSSHRHHAPQLQQRQLLNGRGIMGQGPKSHRTDHIRIQNNYPPTI